MTNKLPVVGKRYRLCVGINDLDRVEYQFCEVKRLTDTAVECLVNGLQLHYYPKDTFLLAWEELPEDKAETINCGNISCEYKSECDSSRRILPKIGQIYIKKTRYARITNVDSEGVTYLEQDGKEFWDCFKDFLDFFEPAEAETKPETQNNHFPDVGKMVLSPEVKDAMEGLKMIVSGSAKFIDMDDVKYSCQNLLNALDKQFMSKEEVKIDIKQEYVDSVKVNETSKSVAVKEQEVKEKEESIWKPISDLPEDNCSVIIRAKGGYEEIFFGSYREDNQHFMDEAMRFVYPKTSIDKYCTLTDFINDYEKLKERVRKLEGK